MPAVQRISTFWRPDWASALSRPLTFVVCVGRLGFPQTLPICILPILDSLCTLSVFLCKCIPGPPCTFMMLKHRGNSTWLPLCFCKLSIQLMLPVSLWALHPSAVSTSYWYSVSYMPVRRAPKCTHSSESCITCFPRSLSVLLCARADVACMGALFQYIAIQCAG